MMGTSVGLAWRGLLRTPGRTLVRILVLSAAVALLGGMLVFIGNSMRSVSSGAVRAVPIHLQGPVGSYSAAQSVANSLAQQSGVQQASAVGTAPLVSAQRVGAVGVTQAGAGAVLGVPPGYDRHLNTFRLLQGTLRPGGVVLDQQMAATLQAVIGDTVSLVTHAGATPVHLTVSGVAVVTAPDILFQPLNPATGPAPAQPPANIALVDLGTFANKIAPSLRAITPASVGSSVQPGAQDGVQWQVQVQLAPEPLTMGGPTEALNAATQAANRLERTLPGQVQFVNNLSDSLTIAAGDALYAQALYIMLALPGALIALGLGWLAALGTVDRDRRELALLRARGFARRELVVLALVESLLLGLVAGVIGTAAGLASVQMIVAGGAQLTLVRGLVTLLICIVIATGGAAVARLGANRSAFTRSVGEGRRSTLRLRQPLWQRLYIDIACLVVSGLVYWLTARTGFSAVVTPDSNPTLSLSIYMFFAPALLWIGSTLLLVRIGGRVLAWAVRRLSGARASTMRGFVLASASRRSAAINRGFVIVGLLLAFGVNLGIFSATYIQQSKVDAQLTLGSDVTVTAAPGVINQRHLESKIAKLPGVTATTAVDHSYAYIGPDLQDTYGIDPNTFAKAATLRDYFFLGVTAKDALSRLANRADAILVSNETITDYSLKVGDLVRLRVLDHRTGTFNVVPFHVAGIVQEFPSAPKDSFMVANASYLSRVSHSGGANVVFATTSGDPKLVAQQIAAATRGDGTQVQNIRDQQARTSSSITTVDLVGISRIEEVFMVLLAAGAMALFVLLGIAERRTEFATMAALGAPIRSIASFLWIEAGIVLGAGTVLAAGLGWLLSKMLVAMLQHVFDPPPDTLAIPWLFLVTLGAAALLATVLVTALATRSIRRMQLGAVLREE